ncbi:RsmE family RNA methyltransferase [Candidatus Dependentiae bacterium]|nr:RsmE family RNA methyltransferase [Candidatus Dependentiae bacterium]
MKTPLRAHEFAFYSESVKHIRSTAPGLTAVLAEKELVNRILKIVRLQKDDHFVLFDDTHSVKATFLRTDSPKSILISIDDVRVHSALTPTIHWLLPLMKREAFEESLYTLTEMGATSIQPLLTEKTGRMWLGEKERIRCHKIMIAAAEQSKQFLIPLLFPVCSLIEWSKSDSGQGMKIFFDASGSPLWDNVRLLDEQNPTQIIACSGPEGDLTSDEKHQLSLKGFSFCALTPTILRAQQAIAVGLGVLRSLTRKK